MPNGVSSAARAPGKAPPAGMLAAWLLLLAILTHALLPLGAPWARTSGSAFSASTVEVSTAPARARPPARASLARRADPPPSSGATAVETAVADATVPFPVIEAAAAVMPRAPDLRGGGQRRAPAQPRAPPAA